MSATDLPPPYYALKGEEASRQHNGGATAHTSSDRGSGVPCSSAAAGVPDAAAAGTPPHTTSAPAAEEVLSKELPLDKEIPQATDVPMRDSEESHNATVVYGPSFEDKESRIVFIQKVLAIKFFQAFAMTLVMLFFVARQHSTYRKQVYLCLVVVSSLFFIATLGLLHYCNRARFIKPYNYMFLAAYPLSVCFFISVITFYRGFMSVFVSWVYFNFILFALLMYSIFALQTNIEFNTKIGHIISGSIVIVANLVTLLLIYDIGVCGIFYCCFTNSALTGYILHDLQTMMSKTYRIRLTPADFMKAALIMHIDYRYMIMEFYNKHFNATQLRKRNEDGTAT